VKQSQSHFSRV